MRKGLFEGEDIIYKEKLYQAILDNMTSGFAYFKVLKNDQDLPVDSEIIDVNGAFEQFVGIKRDELIGKAASRVITPLSSQTFAWIDKFNKAAREGSRESIEIYLESCRKWVWVSMYCPCPGYFVAMLTDINDLKTVEANLRESEARWKFALEGSGDGTWDWDVVSNRVFYSRQFKAMLGFAEDEFGDHLDDWDRRIHTEDRKQVYASIEKHFLGETPYYINEHRILCKDGTYKWVLDRGLVVSRGDDDKPLRVIGAHSDISERKKIEAALHEQQENFRTFFNTIDEFLFVLDMEGRIKKVNKTALDRLGYGREEILNRSFLMLHPEERRDKMRRIFTGIPDGRENTCIIPLLKKNGALILAETRAVSGQWSGNPAIFVVSKDVSSIALSEEKYSRAFHGNPSLMSISTIREGRYLDVNQSFCEKLGYKREEIIGRASLELGFLWSPTERRELIEWVMKEGKVRNYEIEITTRTGEKLVGMVSIDLIHIQSEDYLLIMINDITQRRRMAEELQIKNKQLEEMNEILKMQAVSDSLTRLFNHRHTIESLQSEIQRANRYYQPLTIMMMDLDHFKRVNDSYGHQVGDEVLKTTADIIRSNLRSIDVAGRYGGEEFLVILPQTDLQNSLQVAERIRLQVEKARFEQADLRISISIGVAEYNNEDDLESLLKRVDSLLYLAKNNGRNRIEYRKKKE